MIFKQLVYLDALAREKHFRRAADACNMLGLRQQSSAMPEQSPANAENPGAAHAREAIAARQDGKPIFL